MNFKLKTWAVGPIAALALALVVAGCGGGGGSSGTVAPTSSVYSGPITGFGSVIVNGVRFDTVGATTVDDDGVTVRLEDLRIGMMVTIGGDADDTTGRGTATRLSLARGTKGPITNTPVAAVGDPNVGTFELVGQPVQTDTSTVYVGLTNGFADLALNTVIEVHGVLQSNGTLLATVIESKTGFRGVRLVGLISEFNVDAMTFKVGNLTVNYAALSTAPTGLGINKRVKVKSTATPEGGLLTLTTDSEVEVKSGAAYGETVPANTYLKLKGIAKAGASNDLWTVSGTPVDVSGASYEGGRRISEGAFIEAKGIWDGSVLKATKVETDDPSDDNRSNELYGAVSDVQPSSGTPTSIVVHGVTVDVSTVTPSGGSLSVGSYVEIKGHVVNGVFVATTVEIKAPGGADQDFEDHGVISDFVSAAEFTVNGVTVDASSARFEHGASSDLNVGVYVEIKGALDANGVFIATKVEFKGNDD